MAPTCGYEGQASFRCCYWRCCRLEGDSEVEGTRTNKALLRVKAGGNTNAYLWAMFFFVFMLVVALVGAGGSRGQTGRRWVCFHVRLQGWVDG